MVDVRVPVSVAYRQWTQFEEFPRFMEGVEEVRQIDDTHVHRVAEISGQRHEWDAEIESRQRRTDDWRGRVGSGRVTDDDPTR